MNKINVKRLFIILIIFISNVTMLYGQTTYVTNDSTIAYTIDNDTLWIDEIGNEGTGYIIKESTNTVVDNNAIGYIYAEQITPFNDILDITITFNIDLKTHTGVFRIDGENVCIKQIYNYKMK